jgi:hypothetical protein
VSEIVRGKVELLSLDYLVGLCAKAGIAVGVRLATREKCPFGLKGNSSFRTHR